MDIKNKRILEALQMQPLSQEEMTARHILGRLYGPIATCVESTRNGRLYNRPLWEKALEDDIFLEKVATKALFLELGHPADREETDMKQACACIPEVPKIVGDDLCAYVDILDTPNGRLLKTLVDYGFVPGISSRGSGDVMDNNQVDPETFFLETWDIVQLPAVKKARLNVCESLDSASIQLKKALAESYKTAKDEDKNTMKKALENLNIDINEELKEDSAEQLEEDQKRLTADDIPWDPSEEETLVEDTDDIEDASEENGAEVVETEDSAEEKTANEEDASEENSEDEASNEDEQQADEQASEIDTVSDMVELLQEYDDDTTLEFDAVKVDGKEYEIDEITHFVDDQNEENPILVLGVNCTTSEENSDDAAEDIEVESTTEDEEASEEDVSETETETESADDDGDDEVMESLKEMIRQKEALETELSDLRKAKSVGDAKEKELQEKLARYRIAFKNTSAEAAKVPELQSKVQELTEQLTQSNTKIKTLTEKVNNARQLKESVDNSNNAVNRLNEALTAATKKSEALEAKLEGQTKQYTKKLQERTDLAKSYKARFIETLTRYVESKASMLGVQPSEITSRLNENYTLADVDAVCDQILDSTVNFSRLPFSGRSKTSARIAESVSKPAIASSRRDPEYGYEVDDFLFELAGLK
jgi:hypothetical protein